MRCKNCGWPNEDNVSRCVKCNAPLQGSMIDSSRHNSVSTDSEEVLNSTVREPSSNDNFFTPDSSAENVCSGCGYPISAGMRECPICHTNVSNHSNAADYNFSHKRTGGTINPWATPSDESFCTLKRIPWQNEHVTYEPVSYSGESIILNRSNTDANNNSITSKEQAIISHQNGEWYIENKSELQTTLIRVDRRIKLEDGDVIVLGNRMFEFRKG